MDQKEKVAKAFKAMKPLGYPQRIVRPILTKLLKSYEKQWTFVEEDNYRVLAEAILESEEEKERAQRDKPRKRSISVDEDEDEEYEPRRKRSRKDRQENQSSLVLNSSIRNSGKQKLIEPSYKPHQYMDTQPNTSYTSRNQHGKRETSSSNLSHIRVCQRKGKHLIYDVQSDKSNSLAPLATMEYDGDETGLSLVASEKKMVIREKLKHTNVHEERDGPTDGGFDSEEDAIDNYQCETVLESDVLPLELPNYVVPLEMLPPEYLHKQKMTQKEKVSKAFQAMKSLGYPQRIVRPILTDLLKSYENEWTFIEEDNYRVLAEAILNSAEEKERAQRDKPQKHSISVDEDDDEDEDEEYEPLIRRSRKDRQENQSSLVLIEPSYKPHQYMDTQPSTSHTSRNQHGNRETSSSNLSHIIVYQRKRKHLIYDVQSDKSNSLAPLATMEYDGDETGLSLVASEKKMVTPEKLKHINVHKERDDPTDGDFDSEEDAIDNYQCETVLESDVLPLELPDYRVPLEMLPPDLEGHHSESMSPKQPEAEKNKNDATDSLNPVIASSSNGEVKLSLMVEPSLQIPSLEEVMKQVEEQCIKSYKIAQTGFSMQKLMNDLCARFLATGTTSVSGTKI